jgi:phage-related holin
VESLWTDFVALVDGAKVTILMVLIGANFVTGIAVSIKTKTFRLKQLADFLVSRVIPYVLGYMAVGMVGLVDQAWVPAITITWGVIIATLLGAIAQNLKELGINIPDIFGE